jgi:hypothetical protein
MPGGCPRPDMCGCCGARPKSFIYSHDEFYVIRRGGPDRETHLLDGIVRGSGEVGGLALHVCEPLHHLLLGGQGPAARVLWAAGEKAGLRLIVLRLLALALSEHHLRWTGHGGLIEAIRMHRELGHAIGHNARRACRSQSVRMNPRTGYEWWREDKEKPRTDETVSRNNTATEVPRLVAVVVVLPTTGDGAEGNVGRWASSNCGKTPSHTLSVTL